MSLGIPNTPPTPPVEPPEPPEPPAPEPPAAPGPLSAEAVRSSPEYQEILRQNRVLARQAGSSQAREARARTEAERARQAAEAQQAADLEAELTGILGDEANLAAYEEIATLSQSDPTAAAKKLAQLIAQARAQTPAPGSPPAAPPAPAPEAPVGQPTPPAQPRGLGADAPLGQPPAGNQPDPYDTMANQLEERFGKVAERVQSPETRNRVGPREVAEGMISYVGAALLRAGARPKSG